ncbi:hypothetical protein LCGC14_2196770, partial [marine sediment metagenome]
PTLSPQERAFIVEALANITSPPEAVKRAESIIIKVREG